MTANPFRPSFGITPQVPAGRENTIMQVDLALREGPGSPFRFTLISGARGSGKTVLLNMLENTAAAADWHVVRVPASAEMLHELKEYALPNLLQELDPRPTERRFTGGTVASVGGFNSEVKDKYPAATSLRGLLKQAARFAADQGSGLFLTLDELQSTKLADLHQLSDSIQDCVRDELPIALSVAGLPAEISDLLQHPGTTFLRRAIPISTTELAESDVHRILQETAQLGAKTFSAAALNSATSAIRGYAFLTQLLGSIAFSLSAAPEIQQQDIEKSLPLVEERIGLQVHQPALKLLPEREWEYLQAMQAHSKTGEIAQAMGIPANQQSTYQRRLKDRGLIHSPTHGQVDYALPYLREYIAKQGR